MTESSKIMKIMTSAIPDFCDTNLLKTDSDTDVSLLHDCFLYEMASIQISAEKS